MSEEKCTNCGEMFDAEGMPPPLDVCQIVEAGGVTTKDKYTAYICPDCKEKHET